MTTTTNKIELNADNILRGYTCINTAYEVKDYPYGFRLRTSIFYWIETKKGKGDRFGSYTINPKTGKANAPKYSTYSPFLYMYINEEGHVTTGTINSYHIEEFRMRFYFLTEKFGENFLSNDQKHNIRMEHYGHVLASAPYQIVKYSEEKKQEFKQWLTATLNHIAKCPFAELVEYADRPEEDNPEGEIKMIIREYETDKPKDEPTKHSITVEVVQDILKKSLPGFWIYVSEGKQTFGGNYLKIAMAAKAININGIEGQKIQIVSLSLDLKKLELEPQIYGGNGGQCIYRKPNQEDPKERFLAMKAVKVSFRRPPCNEKDVLAAIERFALNYKKTLIENRQNLMYQDMINYDELLNLKTTV
jgi:hypothetical protein